MNKVFFTAIAFTYSLFIASSVYASGMIGSTIHITSAYPNELAPTNTWDVVVGTGIELTNISPTHLGPMSIDFTDTQIIITALEDFTALSTGHNGFNGIYFTDVNNTIPSFAGATVNATTNVSWFNQSENLSFLENGIWTHFQDLMPQPTGQFMSAGQRIVIDALPFSPEPVPEPTTMLLFGTGLAGIMVARKKRKESNQI